jgi:hypothetical protein
MGAKVGDGFERGDTDEFEGSGHDDKGKMLMDRHFHDDK